MALSHLTAVVLCFAPHAHARTVDRVAAVVGPHIIMMSEVADLAAPYLHVITEKNPVARARAETTVLRSACEQLIDAALVEDEAERVHLRVDASEIDAGLAAIAKNESLTLAQLSAMVRDRGMTDAAYRTSVRAQLLEGKLLAIRARDGKHDGRDVEALAKGFHAELRAAVYVEDRIAP